ncbi:MAG TPA: glycosyltransferase family 2 protein [Desulfuromonadaceae bacterium]|jgi:glycosyltransferase
MNNVYISIITVVRNGEATIGDCMASVLRQAEQPFEYIVINGSSTDRTLDVIKEHSGLNVKIISEPDGGIYDAMNKGINFATGDVIGILNADDFFSHTEVLHRVVALFNDPNVDCCYGDLEYVDSKKLARNVRYWRSGVYSPEKLYWGWMPPHPTFFVRRSLYERFGNFRLDMGTSADYELMLRFLLKYGARATYIPDVLVKMRTGGASNATFRKRLLANCMDRKAWHVNGLKPYPWTLYLKPLSKLTQYIWTRGSLSEL